jgi:hypothetical protein
MDLINFDTKKSLEQLEKLDKASSNRRRSMVSGANKFRKKPLKDLSTEELRSMIGQNSSLKYLVPLAIERLHVDSLLKGDGYEGDLLNAVLTVEKNFWIEDLKGCIPMLQALIEKTLIIVKQNPLDYVQFLQNSAGAIKIFRANIGIV